MKKIALILAMVILFAALVSCEPANSQDPAETTLGGEEPIITPNDSGEAVTPSDTNDDTPVTDGDTRDWGTIIYPS